jgi:hypothetical protein
VHDAEGLRRWTWPHALEIVRSRDALLAAVSYILIAAMCLHWMHPGTVIETGDNYWQYRPFHALLRSFAGWNHFVNVAGARSVGPYALPWLLLAALLSAAGGESFAQIAMLALLRVLAWTGAYALCRALGASRTASLVAAWALLLNPYVLTMTIGSPVLEWLLACFVWIAGIAVVAARDARKRPAATFSLAAMAAAVLLFVAQNPGLIVLAALGSFSFFALGLLVAKDRAAYARWTALTAAAMLAASLWWLVPAANYYLGSTITADTNTTDYSWVVRNSSLLNNLRFIPTWSWTYSTYFTYARAFDSNAITYASSFSLALLLGIGLATARGRKAAVARYCTLVGLVMLFLSKGTHAPFEAVNALLYRVPGFIVFREPTSKTPLLALVLLVPVAAFAIDAVASRVALALRASRAAALATCACVVFAASAVSAYPLLTGEVFHGATPGLPSVYVKLPQYWRDAAAFLNERADRGAVTVLPTGTYYQTNYTWGYYGYDGLAYLLIDRPVEQEILGTYTQTPQVNAIAERIVRAIGARSPFVRSMLADFDVRYLLFRGDARMNGGVPSPSERDILAIPGIVSVHHFGPLDVVDLGDPGPSVTETRDWVASDGETAADTVLESRTMFEHLPRIDVATTNASLFPPPAVFENAGALAPIPMPASVLAGAPQRFVAGTAAAATQLVHYSSGAVLKTSYLRPAGERNTVRLTARELADPSSAPAVPLLYENPPTDMGRIELFNPAPAPIQFDLQVAVQSDQAETYVLSSAGGLWKSSRVAAASEPVFAKFSNVVARPGPNVFSLGSDSSNAVGFGELHFARVGALSDPTRATRDADVGLARSWRPHAIVGSVPLGIPADARPSIQLEIARDAFPLSYGAVAELSYGGRNYRCYVRAPAENHSDADSGNASPWSSEASTTNDALSQAIAACLKDDVLYRQATTGDLARTLVRAVDIDIALSPKDKPSPASSPSPTPMSDSPTVNPGIASVAVSWDGTASRSLASAAAASNDADVDESERSGNAYTYRFHAEAQTLSGNLVGHLVQLQTPDGTFLGRVEAEDARGLLLRDQDGGREWRPFASIDRVGIIGAGTLDLDLTWSADSPFRRGQYLGIALEGDRIEAASATFEAQTAGGRRRFSAPLHVALAGDGAYIARFADRAFGAAGGSIRRIELNLRVGARVVDNSVRVRIQLPDDSPAGRPQIAVVRSGQSAGVVWTDPRLSLFALGAAPRPPSPELAEHVAFAADGLSIATRPAAASKPAILATHELFDPQWQGLCFGGCRPLLQHFQVDGYRNGWLVSGEGTIVLFETVVVVQAVLAVASLGLLVLLASRLRRRVPR